MPRFAYHDGLVILIFIFICSLKFTVDATAEFRPAQTQTTQTSFTSYLVMIPPVETLSVSVSCQASVVNSIDEADNLMETPDCSFTSTATGTTAPPTVNTTAALTTPPDPNSGWFVVNSRFDIPANPTTSSRSYLAVTTRRELDPVADVVEIVVTTCCILDSSSNTNYLGDVAVAVAVARVSPFYCANCNNSLRNPTAERTIQNPGYVEIAPCPCDLTLNECNFGCECDSECAADDVARFGSTILGLLGGQDAAAADYECDAKTFNLPDWHPLTCVYWEENGYLGLYYQNKAKLTSLEAVTSASRSFNRDRFSLAEFERRNVDRDFSRQQYQQGLILQTQMVSNPDSSGKLSLPQSISGSTCNPLVPVRYLMPFESSCASQLTTESCVAGSAFSALVYAMPNDTATNFRILSSFSRGSAIATEVRYYCLTDYSSYEPTSATPLGSQDPSTISGFPNTLQNEDCSHPCDNPTCWQYNSGRSFPASPSLPAECTSPPSEPSLDSSNTCNNVVLDIRYTFEWSGPEIRRLVASIFLANVAGVDTPRSLAQKFSVQWQHVLNATNPSDADNFLNSTAAYSRSGNGGYEPGRPLFSGCSNENPTTGDFTNVDTGDEMQIAIWRPGVDGMCADARRQFMTFGDDTMSSCALRLDFNQLNNSCAELRQIVSNHLNVLMAGDVIGRYGYNDPTDETMWIPILRQNLSEIQIPTPPLISVNSSDNVTIFRLADEIHGVCFLPTAINLNVLYAQTGASFGHPRYEVVGAYINYTHSNWSLNCMGVNSQRCDASSGLVQNFFLHSSVRFVQVPPVPPEAKSRFYTRYDPYTCNSDSCYRFLADFATDECYYDSCWQEIAYPLTSEYRGDSHEYALAFFLVIILGVLGYAAVSKPGWS